MSFEGRKVFVADVHLTPEYPDRADRFFRFLESESGRAEQVYILGDLFDLWVSPGQVMHPDYRELVARLRSFSERGTRISFLHGNRDFHIGAEFHRATGIEVHADPMETRIDGRRVLLTHGDLLCGADRAYQRTRRVLRSPACRKLAQILPFRFTYSVAKLLRGYSRRAVSRKSRRILEPTADALKERASAGYDVIVFGHVHDPKVREVVDSGHRCFAVSVGDWSREGSFVEWENGGWTLRTWEAGGAP